MDQRIIDLKSTTFSGRRLNRRQIADIQETVEMLPNDSRNELAKTICEHLGWNTAKGAYRVGACLGMLETLESHGILRLPPKREDSVRDMKAVRRAGLDLRLRPAAGDRGAAVRAASAPRRAGHRHRRTAAVERLRRPPPLSRLQAPLRGAYPLLCDRPGRPQAGVPAVRCGDEAAPVP